MTVAKMFLVLPMWLSSDWINVGASLFSAIAAVAAAVAAIASWRTARDQLTVQVFERRQLCVDAVAKLSRRLLDDGLIGSQEVEDLATALRLMRELLPGGDVATAADELEVAMRIYILEQDNLGDLGNLKERGKLIQLCSRLRNGSSPYLCRARKIFEVR